MIDRQHGKILIECDCCPETFQGETNDFREEWAVAKGMGWRTRKVADEWFHFCPNPRCKP